MDKTSSRIISVLIFALAVCAFAGMRANAADCEGIATAQGPVSGVLDEGSGVCSFLGVPFAAPPVGELRFKKPQPHEAWTEPIVADKVGNQCPQQAGPMTDKDIPMSEDCLYLNIWQPAGAREETKPVVVFIHGGGFVVGSGGNSTYNGAKFARYGDLIMVTMNYRLSVPGFMAHPALLEAGYDVFNRGLYDQLAALKWVKENIAAFGGDPDNITLFGQSAGGMSVGFQLTSPMAAGIFKNVGIHSAPPIMLNVGKDWALAQGERIAEKVGCTDEAAVVECLINTPADKYLQAAPPGIFIMDDASIGDKFFYQPVIDGEFIPEAPYKMLRDGRFNADAHVLILSTKDEASYFSLNKDLKTAEGFAETFDKDAKSMMEIFDVDFTLADKKLEKVFAPENFDSPKDAYDAFITDTGFTCTGEIMATLISEYQPQVYRLYHTKAPFKIVSWGAFHGSELPYIFNFFDFLGQKFAKKDNNMALTKKMIALYSAYAHTGAPHAEGLPELPPYSAASPSYLVTDDELTIETGLKADTCAAVSELFKLNFE